MSTKHYRTSSVIIPSYNEPYYLSRCLAALHKQTRPIDEIIVVDNNTEDDSIERAKAEFPGVTFLTEPRQGLVFARNTGFKAASGDILIKIDADMIADPRWHELLMEDMQSSQADAWSGYIYNEELYSRIRPFIEKATNLLIFQGIRLVSGSPFMIGCNLAMTRDSWEQIRQAVHMRNDIWEDLDMSVWLARVGADIKVSKQMNGKISSRAVNVAPGRLYRRLFGQARVYRLHRKPISFILSLLFMHVAFAGWFFCYPFAKLGQQWSTRPRPEQY